MMISMLSTMLHAHTLNAQASADDYLPATPLPSHSAMQPGAMRWQKVARRGAAFGIAAVYLYALLFLFYSGLRYALELRLAPPDTGAFATLLAGELSLVIAILVFATLAAILSAAMMLRHSFGREEGAARIEAAVGATLRDAIFGADLGGTATTQEVGDAVLARL